MAFLYREFGTVMPFRFFIFALLVSAAAAACFFPAGRVQAGDAGKGWICLRCTITDRRLQENIAPTKTGLDALMKIGVEDYNFIDDKAKKREQGIIAQDLYKVYPEAVRAGGSDMHKNPWLVDYGSLTPLIVRSVQEQQAEIEALKREIGKLRAALPAAERAK